MQQPIGPPVLPNPSPRPERQTLEGEYVSLVPLAAAGHWEALYNVSHGEPATEAIWTYLPYGPFADAGKMREWLAEREKLDDPLAFTVIEKSRNVPVGITTYCSITPEMRRIEVGHIWYGPSAQRTQVNTESIYLLLRHAFDDLSYRRVEWKCDALNARSRAAAVRLGFVFEGVFEQHMIVKGRNRDTAWYALVDHRWPAVRRNMERWLYDNPEHSLSLRELNETI